MQQLKKNDHDQQQTRWCGHVCQMESQRSKNCDLDIQCNAKTVLVPEKNEQYFLLCQADAVVVCRWNVC